MALEKDRFALTEAHLVVFVGVGDSVVVEQVEGIGRGFFVFLKELVHEVVEENDAGAVRVKLSTHDVHVPSIALESQERKNVLKNCT